MKYLLLISLLLSLSQATYYDLGDGYKVKEFTPKSDNTKVCIAVKLYASSVSLVCFDKKDTKSNTN